MKPDTIILHHSAIGGEATQLHRIDAYHKSLGFPRSSMGFYVGYHCLIEKSGRKIWTRRPTEHGAHSGSKWNDRSIGICLAGNFVDEQPTKTQLNVLRDLVRRLKKRYNIQDVKLHYEVRPTKCPAIDLRLLLDKYAKIPLQTRSNASKMAERVLGRKLARLLARGFTRRFWRLRKDASV